MVGVSDDGTSVGIEADNFKNEDKMSLHLVNIVKAKMGPQAMTSAHIHFEEHDEKRVLMVQCSRSSIPVYVKDGDTERFYVRTGPSTSELSASQIQSYIKQRFSQSVCV